MIHHLSSSYLDGLADGDGSVTSNADERDPPLLNTFSTVVARRITDTIKATTIKPTKMIVLCNHLGVADFFESVVVGSSGAGMVDRSQSRSDSSIRKSFMVHTILYFFVKLVVLGWMNERRPQYKSYF